MSDQCIMHRASTEVNLCAILPFLIFWNFITDGYFPVQRQCTVRKASDLCKGSTPFYFKALLFMRSLSIIVSERGRNS